MYKNDMVYIACKWCTFCLPWKMWIYNTFFGQIFNMNELI